jgi:hypothetical protein
LSYFSSPETEQIVPSEISYLTYSNVYRFLVGRSEVKRPLGRPRSRWEDNIKPDLREIEIDGRTRFGWLRIGSRGGLLWIR